MPKPTDHLLTFARGIDALNDWCGRTISWLTAAMVLVYVAVVVLRYFFNLGWIAMQESVTYMHAIVFMLGAAYTLKQDGHVRVDIFYRRFSPRGKAWVNLLGTLFLLFPTFGFILWISWEYVAVSWELMESSRETGGLPGVYLIKTLIPVAAALFLLQGAALGVRSLLLIMGTEADGPEDASAEETVL